jgi:2-aminoethylphosphonate-pyruvate transaminase
MLLNDKKNPYILLTPGPLSTSPSVRSAMEYDVCTWDDDYKNIVTDIRTRLLAIANCDPARYTTVLMQGSGTFSVESVLGSSIDREKHQILILSNGVYGKRMVEIANVLNLPHLVYEVAENQPFDAHEVASLLQKNKMITHLAMVHCETTTGMLNDLTSIAALSQTYQLTFIVDAMSSFGGIQFDMTDLGIDFLISSANKCIQGVPGFAFVICKKVALEPCRHQAKSLSLDLYGQWQEMEKNAGKWRYTSPTHVVLAFRQALIELEQEGGISARSCRYRDNQACLVEGMQALGFESYIPAALQSSIITTFLQPDCIPQSRQPFFFTDFYNYLKEHGFVIYPGKVTNRSSFRIGSIGHLFLEDVAIFLEQVKAFIEKAKTQSHASTTNV